MPKRWRTRGKPLATPRRVSQPTRLARNDSAGPFPGDAEVPGGTFLIGATPDFPFAFDNEKWAHPVEIKPFRIARAPVTNGEFLAFVEDGGYRKAQFWSESGWRWLEGSASADLERSFAKFFNQNISESREPPSFKEKLDHPGLLAPRSRRPLAPAGLRSICPAQ